MVRNIGLKVQVLLATITTFCCAIGECTMVSEKREKRKEKREKRKEKREKRKEKREGRLSHQPAQYSDVQCRRLFYNIQENWSRYLDEKTKQKAQ